MRIFTIGSKYEYCLNGNYWQDISSIFDKYIYLFCDCNKCKGQVYIFKPFNITKKIKKEVIEGARNQNKLEEIRDKIDTENMQKVAELLK